MLVLTRRLNQSIQIGDDIVITVVEIRGDQVRLGISAPRTLPVHRAEVVVQVRQENSAAAGASVEDVDAISEILPGNSPTT